MPYNETAPPPPPMPGDPPYLTKDEAAAITLGMKLRLRPTWPTEGGVGCGPDVEIVGISNDPDSQTGRLLYMRDKRDRFVRLDAAWILPDPRLDPFFTP